MLRSFTRPVAKLEEVMTAMQADGDLSRRVDIQGTDEIGRMANAFNALADGFAEERESGQRRPGQTQVVGTGVCE